MGAPREGIGRDRRPVPRLPEELLAGCVQGDARRAFCIAQRRAAMPAGRCVGQKAGSLVNRLASQPITLEGSSSSYIFQSEMRTPAASILAVVAGGEYCHADAPAV